MKKRLLTIVLLALTAMATAQQDGREQQDSTLRTKNIPVPSTTSAPQIQDAKAKSDREMQAEKEAKDKGRIQPHTEVEPDKIIPPVRDTLKVQPKPR